MSTSKGKEGQQDKAHSAQARNGLDTKDDHKKRSPNRDCGLKDGESYKTTSPDLPRSEHIFIILRLEPFAREPIRDLINRGDVWGCVVEAQNEEQLIAQQHQTKRKENRQFFPGRQQNLAIAGRGSTSKIGNKNKRSSNS